MVAIKTIKIALVLTITLFLISCGVNKMKIAEFETNQGTIKVKLFTEEMPITTKNFIGLAEKGFYDETRFHRIIPQFMIQGGDPLSKDESSRNRWGTGGPGYNIKDEFGTQGNDKGTIAMANAGPDTGGSQFFINLVDNNYLDNKHPVFGKVVEGMDLVEKIGAVKTNSQDQPIEDIIIKKIIIH